MDLKGKAAIVTGGGQGIGKAICLKLAEAGADVAVFDLNFENAQSTSQEIRKLSRKSEAFKVDVTEWKSVEDATRRAMESMDKVHILVNNAGWDRVQPFIETKPEFWNKIIAINLMGVIHCSRAVLDPMIERQAGKIINIASDAGRVGSLGETVYAGAKGGVIAFSKSLAREMAKYNINVNSVCPGPTDTPLLRAQPNKVVQALVKAIPFGRVARPEEIAETVLFFASPCSDYITGQVLSVSGGLTTVG
ncbi:MAG: 3-oxoacyl-ACP reductase FabG [bacterium]|nr:3-oxoacyl-ACP reductase FabG [bacterium]